MPKRFVPEKHNEHTQRRDRHGFSPYSHLVIQPQLRLNPKSNFRI